MRFNERLRVLVVDDEPTICRALTIALGRAGYDVVAVEAGEQAHTLLRAEHFDFLVLDLRIPDLRGDVLFELAASIQPHLRYRTLFTTGDTSERAHTLLRAEHFDFLVLDLRIPDLRGDVLFELAASIQPHLRYRTLFTTGDASERALELIAACGCKALHKPFELQDLMAELAKLAPRVRDATA